MLERDIEQFLTRVVNAAGGETRKVQWVGRVGAPDRVVMLPPRTGSQEARLIWVEVKAPGKKPRPTQLREHQRMRELGQRVVVVDSYDKVEDVIR